MPAMETSTQALSNGTSNAGVPLPRKTDGPPYTCHLGDCKAKPTKWDTWQALRIHERRGHKDQMVESIRSVERGSTHPAPAKKATPSAPSPAQRSADTKRKRAADAAAFDRTDLLRADALFKQTSRAIAVLWPGNVPPILVIEAAELQRQMLELLSRP